MWHLQESPPILLKWLKHHLKNIHTTETPYDMLVCHRFFKFHLTAASFLSELIQCASDILIDIKIEIEIYKFKLKDGNQFLNIGVFIQIFTLLHLIQITAWNRQGTSKERLHNNNYNALLPADNGSFLSVPLMITS